MSTAWDQHRRAESEKQHIGDSNHIHRREGHDRIHGDNLIPGVSATIAMSGDNEDVEIGITAGQKMLSAMSGSFVTSLLSKY